MAAAFLLVMRSADDDTRTARPLFRAIHSQAIIEDVLQAYPLLRGE